MNRARQLLLPIFAAGCLTSQTPATDLDGRIERIQPVRVVTSDSRYFDYFPAVSPDGREVIFARNDAELAGKWRLWKATLGGGEPQPLTPADLTYDCTRPSWSHDGRRIAFRASQGGKGSDIGGGAGGIWLMSPSGGETKALTEGKKYDDYYPEWSPDDTWLAFSRSLVKGDDKDNIWIVAVDGKDRRITENPKYDGKTTVSPNGKEIAFASNRDGRLNIWIVDVERGEPSARQFTHNQGRAPAWSPDGKWIAFESNRSGHYAIYIEAANGGPAIQVTDDKSVAQHPAWTSDGRSIVFDAHSKDVKGYIASVDVHDVAR